LALSKEQKSYILREFLRSISHLVDREYPRRVWILAEGPECQAYDDAVCDFFDQGNPIIENYKDYEITESQHHLLKHFRDEFRAFSSEHSDFPEEFIDTPEWEGIMKMAKEVLDAFNYKN